MNFEALYSQLDPVFSVLGQKYFGIPLVLHIIGFTHLAIMAAALFGQTLLELVEKKFSK